MKKPQKTHFSLGLVGPPFGLKGFVKVKSLSGEFQHFLRLKEVLLRQGEKEENFEIAEIQTQGERNSSTAGSLTLLIRFNGIDNPEKAKNLKGAAIIASREFAAPLKEGEFYVEDLKGIEVFNNEGKLLGEIMNILEGGGGHLAEIKLFSDDLRLVPFRKEFFGEIDLKEGRTVLLEPWVIE